jgi:hypothetical protein
VRLLAAAILAGMVVAAGPAARADEGAAAGPYGVMGDVGLPDGMVASFAYRARPPVRLHLGLGHNTNSFGLRAGVAATPFQTRAVTPYVALEGGWYFSADTAGWMQSTAKKAGLDDKTLQAFGYRYLNLFHLGARFGGGAASFYLQGGVSFIRATASIIKPKPNYEPPVDLYRETVVHVWTLSGRAGVIYFF